MVKRRGAASKKKKTTPAPGTEAQPRTSDPTDGQPLARYPNAGRRTTHKKKKVLMLCSRGVTSAFRELMEDLIKLLPHAKKDPKFDKREPLSSLNEISQLMGCRYCIYLEARKMQDLYLWAASTDPEGPSVKFLVQKIKTMRDLRLTGNCLLGSRPFLTFDSSFSEQPYTQVLKQLLGNIFGTPKGHPQSKPFHDHVLHFSFVDGRVFVRHYQVLPPLSGAKADMQTLVEIGPRFSLVPIRIFGGAFGGQTLYFNGQYVSPNEARSDLKRKAGRSARSSVAQKEKRRVRYQEEGVADLPEDVFEDVFTS
jgi:ribosome biogenesis protein BRX1|tara:strand:+ start:862 stop:1788 length:927 start_codon:yes stop_codon:yes gene_type:complete